MLKTGIASAALFGAHALATGSAIVINACSYDVILQNTPSAGGGYSTIDQTLSASGGSYSQVYTELTNGNGWSLKLSKDSSMSDILQYEYTFHNDGTIWYDLSAVNGNPWDGDWEITATSGCTPRQAAYQYSTDDAFGMQACADSASITVTLCSGDGGSSGSSPSPSPSPSPAPTTTPTTTIPAATPTTTWPAKKGEHHHWGGNNEKVESPTTLATVADSQWTGPAVTVTNVAVQTVTQYYTATAQPERRHAHHPRHPHHRR